MVVEPLLVRFVVGTAWMRGQPMIVAPSAHAIFEVEGEERGTRKVRGESKMRKKKKRPTTTTAHT